LDNLTPERRSANMSKIRAKNTSPEMAVRRLVHGMGFRYRLHVAALPGKPDLVFPRSGKIIQVHGCFWHRHKGCTDSHIPKTRVEYWKPKLERNQRRDRANEKALRRQGWEVLIIWQCEVNATALLSDRIEEFLRGTPARAALAQG
jgi:DNA mismatch endonuclease, patch repair protein